MDARCTAGPQVAYLNLIIPRPEDDEEVDAMPHENEDLRGPTESVLRETVNSVLRGGYFEYVQADTGPAENGAPVLMVDPCRTGELECLEMAGVAQRVGNGQLILNLDGRTARAAEGNDQSHVLVRQQPAHGFMGSHFADTLSRENVLSRWRRSVFPSRGIEMTAPGGVPRYWVTPRQGALSSLDTNRVARHLAHEPLQQGDPLRLDENGDAEENTSDAVNAMDSRIVLPPLDLRHAFYSVPRSDDARTLLPVVRPFDGWRVIPLDQTLPVFPRDVWGGEKDEVNQDGEEHVLVLECGEGASNVADMERQALCEVRPVSRERLIPIFLTVSDGQLIKIQALLDTGSTRTFLSKELADQLSASCIGRKQDLMVRVANGDKMTITGNLYTLTLCFGKGHPPTQIEALQWDGLQYQLLLGMDMLPLLWKRGASEVFDGLMSVAPEDGAPQTEISAAGPDVGEVQLPLVKDQTVLHDGRPLALDDPLLASEEHLVNSSAGASHQRTSHEELEISGADLPNSKGWRDDEPADANDDSWEVKASKDSGIDLHAKSYDDIAQSAEQIALDKLAAPYVAAIDRDFASSLWRPVRYVTPRPRTGPGGRPFQMHLQVKPGAVPKKERLFVEKPLKERAKMTICRQLEQAGVIELSASPWRHQCFVVPKKDEHGKPLDLSLGRFIVDLRASNEVIVIDQWPCATLEEVHQTLSRAVILSEVDLASAFFQLILDKESRELTAFAAGGLLWQFVAAPMGCKNSCQNLARWLNFLLRDFIIGRKSAQHPSGRKCVALYVDNVYIFSESDSVAEHNEDLRAVLSVMAGDDILLSRSKSRLFMTAIKALGFYVGQGSIYPCADKTKAMRNLPEPKNLRQLRGCLGLFQFYSRFVKNYSDIVAPLQALQKKNVRWTWGPRERKSFLSIKDALVQAVPLRLPHVDASYLVQSDASSYSLGGTLSMWDAETLNWRPVEFYSKKFDEGQRSYHIYRKESLALAACIARWKGYLIAKPFVLEVENHALKHLKDKDARLLLHREVVLLEELGNLSFEIRHVPSERNTADIFTRQPGTGLQPYHLWDLGSGSGSLLRGIQLLAEDAGFVQRKLLLYQSVEIDPWARLATKKVYESVLEKHPFLFGLGPRQIARFGHDVRKLLLHPDFQGGMVRADHVCFGVPCQPFSAARHKAPGLDDKRELFTTARDILRAIFRNPRNSSCTFAIECVLFGIPSHSPHLQSHLDAVDAMFAPFGARRSRIALHGRFTGAVRNRFVWHNYDITPLPELNKMYTFAAVLDEGWRPAVMDTPPGRSNGLYAATLMASSTSQLRTSGANDVLRPDGTRVRLPLRFEERLQGLQPEDTLVSTKDKIIGEADRIRLIGNAIPAPLHAHLLRKAMAPYEVALFDEVTVEDESELEERIDAIEHLATSAFEQSFQEAVTRDAEYSELLEQAQVNPDAAGFSVFEGRLYDNDRRCIVPADDSLRQEIIQVFHDAAGAGHQGVSKTIHRVKDYFMWQTLARDVSAFVQSCDVCQRTAPENVRRRGDIFPLEATYPRQILSMDFFSVTPRSGRDSTGQIRTVTKVWVTIDQMSKYVRLIPLDTRQSRMSAQRLVDIYLRDLLPVFGVPEGITSDNDVLFTSKLWQSILRALGVKQNFITPYRPSGNGQAENSVKTALRHLRAVMNTDAHEAPTNWWQAIPLIELAMNTSVHRTTRFTPAELHFGRRFTMPIPLMLPRTALQDMDSAARDIMAQVRDNTVVALQRIRKVNEDMRLTAERRGGTDPRRVFEIGDEVLLTSIAATAAIPTVGGKLAPTNFGPYVVRARLQRGTDLLDTYRVQAVRVEDAPLITVNADRMRLFRSSDPGRFPLPRQQVPEGYASTVATFDWTGISLARDWSEGTPPRYMLWRGGMVAWHYVPESDICSDSTVFPTVSGQAGIPQGVLALQAIQSYEHQEGQITEVHWPRRHGAESDVEQRFRTLCETHLMLLRNLPVTEALPEYEMDSNGQQVLREHWEDLLRGLRERQTP